MGLAGFDEGEDGEEKCKSGKGAVFKNLLETDGLVSREAATINVHVQEIGAGHNRQKAEHDQRYQ